MNTIKQHKKVPGFLGLFVLLIGIGVTVYLAGTQTNIFQHAAPSETPQNIRITNISSSAFTLTYQTDAAFIGTLTLGDGNNTQTILDDRDQKSGTPHTYSLHSISAKNLEPATTYSFSVLSGTTTYLNNGQKFSVTTASTLSASPSAVAPLAGKIVAEDGTIPPEALVYVTTDGGQTLSTLTDSSGLYILPINTMLTKDLTSQIDLAPTTTLQLLVTSPDATAQASISVEGSNPIPAITLGQTYDFTLSTTPIASSSATGGFPVFALDQSLVATPQILTPATPNQGFTDDQPLFKGKAKPNEDVQIVIHSDQAITKTVTADANGNWSFRPATPLSPGQHTISISTTNAEGIIQTIQRSFTVYAAGSQVTQSATPSATLTPKPTVKPTATPTAQPQPKSGGSLAQKLAPSPTLIPTGTPTPLPDHYPSGTPTPTPIPVHPKNLPPTGSNTTVIIGITGILTTLVGMMIFLLTKGAVL